MNRPFFSLIGVIFLISACSSDANLSNNRATALLQAGDASAAAESIESALVSSPEDPIIYYNASLIYYDLGVFDRAIASNDQAITRGADQLTAQSYYNRGNMYFENQQYENAISAFQNALRFDPTFEDARFNLELSLMYRELPTPTPIELQTEPEEQGADPSATPSPNPGGFAEPSPTPTPPEPLPPGEEGSPELFETPQGEPGDSPLLLPTIRGDMSLEEVERVLDPVKEDQEGLGGIPTVSPLDLTPQSGKDW